MTTSDRHADLDPAASNPNEDPARSDTADDSAVDVIDPDAAPYADPADEIDPERDMTTMDAAVAQPVVDSEPGATGHLTGNPAATVGSDESEREPLLPGQRAEEYSARWDVVKGGFVDEPRDAVDQADQLVSELLDDLQELFRQQRQGLVDGLDANETSTEDLRIALRRYRSFFDRLLSV